MFSDHCFRNTAELFYSVVSS